MTVFFSFYELKNLNKYDEFEKCGWMVRSKMLYLFIHLHRGGRFHPSLFAGLSNFSQIDLHQTYWRFVTWAREELIKVLCGYYGIYLFIYLLYHLAFFQHCRNFSRKKRVNLDYCYFFKSGIFGRLNSLSLCHLLLIHIFRFLKNHLFNNCL